MRTFTRESTAWQYIADTLEARGQMSKSTWGGRQGLCWEIMLLHDDQRISWSVKALMDDRIDELRRDNYARGGEDRPYLWRRGDVRPRIIAAQLIALQVRAEERATARRAKLARHEAGWDAVPVEGIAA